MNKVHLLGANRSYDRDEGMYYDDANPKFLDLLETAALLTKAREKKAEKERQRNEHTAKIGAERLRLLIPSNAKAVILSVNYG